MQTDRMIFIALQNLYNALDEDGLSWPGHSATAKAYLAADEAMIQFELELGPLPDWAAGHNIAQEPVQYAQLFTRDGRRCGNAVISQVVVPPTEDCVVYYHVITDMGSEMCLNINELNEIFEVGPYIHKAYGIALRARQNWPRAMGELGTEE